MVRIGFRLAFSTDKPAPEIVCSGCGSRELQSGIAVEPSAIKQGQHESGETFSHVDTSRAQALCESCTRFLMAAQGG